jgi:hypothetical protein
VWESVCYRYGKVGNNGRAQETVTNQKGMVLVNLDENNGRTQEKRNQ